MATNVFQKEVGSLLASSFIISERVDDAATNRYGTFQVSKKPYDFYGATKTGKLWGAEAKMVKEPRFPVRYLTQEQRLSLSKLEDNNCLAFVIINWRYPRTGEAILIPFGEYCLVEYNNISNARKSVKPVDFDEDWFLVRQVGGWIIPKNHKLHHLL